jgi:hypothetical protein
MPDDTAPLDPATFLREHVAPRARRRVEELRDHIGRLERELHERLAAEATIQLELEGSGGGIWYLTLRDGDMQVADSPAGIPLMRVCQTREDWEALARAQLATSGGGAPAGGDLTRARVERLRTLDGSLQFRLATDEGERVVTVRFGAGEPAGPRCTLRLRADDARRLQAGELPPQAAFLQGLVKIEGDVAFAMQVGAALFL